MKKVLFAMEPRLMTSPMHGRQGFLNCLFLIRCGGDPSGVAAIIEKGGI